MHAGTRSLVLPAILAVFAVHLVHTATAQATDTSWGRLKALYGRQAPPSRIEALDPSYERSLEARGISLFSVVPIEGPADAVVTLGWAPDGDLVVEIVFPGGRVAWNIKEDLNSPRTKCVQAFADCWTYCDRRYAGGGWTVGDITFPGFQHIACRIDCEIDLAVCVGRSLGDQLLDMR
jgi:hypothetical protein